VWKAVWVCALAGCAAQASAELFTVHAKRFRVGPNPTGIAVADLNEDGYPDIVTSNRGRLRDIREERPAEDSLSYLTGRADLGFDSQPPLRTGFGPYDVVAANIDALKALDVIAVNFHATRDRDLTLLRNIGELLFEPHDFTVDDETLPYARMNDADGYPVFSQPGLTSLAIADIDRDGYRDVVATAWSSDRIVYFPGHPDRYFDEPVLIPLEGGPRDVAIADIDGDGELDLAVTLYNHNEIAVLRGDGSGGFERADRFVTRGRLPHRIRVADMNGDGRPDLVVSHTHAEDSVAIFYGEDGFAFSVAQEIVLGEDRTRMEFDIRDMAVADLNGDGRPDIALACDTSKSVEILMNDSSSESVPQSFDRETYTFEAGRPNALALAHFDGDDRPDLAVALWDEDTVALLLSDR